LRIFARAHLLPWHLACKLWESVHSFKIYYHCCFVMFFIVFFIAPNLSLGMLPANCVNLFTRQRQRDTETQRRDGKREAGRGVLKRVAPLSQLCVQLVKLAETTPHNQWPGFASQLHLLTLAPCLIEQSARGTPPGPGRWASGMEP
jgi:hypothetical protein